ncbi:MAG TPA: T9SS type A sorting domain-containing protein [Bacteroidales bacterium]|nr:T9SS type A sorting domain-containing protein [Bacteroidales bacterium]
MKRLILFFLGILLVNLTYSQDIVVEKVRNAISIGGEAKILIPMAEIKDLDLLANTINLDYPKGNNWLAYVNEKEYNNFLKLNLKHSFFEEGNSPKALTMATNMAQMNNWDKYPTYEVYDSIMRRFAQTYPTICKLDTIGFSVNNKLILSLRISSNPNQDIDKPKFFYSSTMHGDELAGYVFMLRLSDWLLSSYGVDQRATDIINNTQVFINPLANPDGTYAGYGGNSNVSYSKRYNANNIDLNRNYPCPVAGPHPDSYQWQAETLAFMAYSDSNDFSISANLHSGAEVLNYPYDCYYPSVQSHSDANWFINVCMDFLDSIPPSAPSSFFTDVSSSGYTNGGDWYRVSGGRQDYQTYFKYGREITFEISSDKRLATSSLNNYWGYLRGGLISYIENCQRGLEGYIRDSATNEPIRAKIWIENHDQFNSEVYSKTSTGYYYRPILSGNYTVTFSAEGYQSKTITNIQVINGAMTIQDVMLAQNEVGLERIEGETQFTIFPNPAKNVLKVSLNTFKSVKNTYSIKNALGVEVIRGRIANKTTNIDISNLNRGIYFISIGAKTTKFIKE